MTTLSKQIKNLEVQFLHVLRNKGLKIHPDAYSIITENQIEIGLLNIEKMSEDNIPIRLFGSTIDLYFRVDYFTKEEVTEIGFGTSGSFNPNDLEQRASKYRTIHSAEIVKNWNEGVKDEIKTFCNTYRNICETFHNSKLIIPKN